jgi:omega-amidase
MPMMGRDRSYTRTMKVAGVQFDIAWEDKAANHGRIEAMLEEAGIEAGTFLLLPELADTGFSLNVHAIVDDRSAAWAAGLARRRSIWVQMGYPSVGPDGMGRNCATIFSPDGEAIGTYEKVHPFSYGREVEHYASGERLVIRELAGLPEQPVVCPLLCYDRRFPELWRLAAAAGAEIFTIGASWPSARQSHWRALLIARAIENQTYIVAVNRVGEDPHLSYSGGSMIVAPTGEVLAEAGKEQTVLAADLDLPALRRWRAEFPALGDLKKSLLGRIDIDRSPVGRPMNERGFGGHGD